MLALMLCAVPGGTAVRTAQFRTDVDAVELSVSVVDAQGAPIGGLVREDFRVLDDGRPQSITTFSAGRVPLTLAVALDRSFSVAGRPLAMMKTAVADLVDALALEDRVMLLGVGSRVEVLSPLGADRAALRQALVAVDAFGTTSLGDAIVAAVDGLEPAGGRRAVVLLSDGRDRYSAATVAEVTAHAGAADVLVFPIAVGGDVPPLFIDVAAATGGRAIGVRDPSRLRATLRTLLAELGAQYVIGYVPARHAAGREWRAVQVSVALPGLAVRTRRGYWTR